MLVITRLCAALFQEFVNCFEMLHLLRRFFCLGLGNCSLLLNVANRAEESSRFVILHHIVNRRSDWVIVDITSQTRSNDEKLFSSTQVYLSKYSWHTSILKNGLWFLSK